MTIKEQFQKMFALAQAYNACKECYDVPLFQAFLYNLISSKPGELNTTGILTDTYNFYMKWYQVWGDIQWSECVEESHKISHKYNCDMVDEMLVQILDVLEKKFSEGAKK